MIIFKIGGYGQNGGYRAAHPLRRPEWVRMARISQAEKKNKKGRKSLSTIEWNLEL
jgi:hypothetical protein